MKSLNVLINYNESNIKEEEKGEVISKIEDIDADKLIFQIPYKGDEEYELLKIIRDDSIFSKYKDEIDDLYNKVEEIYSSYKNPNYYSHGPYYPQLIYIELYKVLNFYIENYLIIDIFSDFKKYIQKGLEALLLSHITNKNYRGRLEKLSSDFFKYSLFYYDSKSLFKFLNSKHKVEKLIFDEKSLSEILNYSSNFFESFYTKSRAFSLSHKNEQIFNQLNRDIFENNMSRIFKNISIILLFVDMPKDRSNRFIESLIRFLEHETFLSHDSIKYFIWFFEKNYSLFSFEDCKSILKIVHNKMRKYETNHGIDSVAYVMIKNNYELFDDEDYIYKILNDFNYYDSKKSIIPYLWKISNKNIKNKLKDTLIEQLKLDFKEDIYKTACFEGVLDYNLFFEDYIKEINRQIGKNYLDSDIYTLKQGKPRIDNFTLVNVFLFIYHMKIKSTDERLNLFSNLPDSIKFFLFRDKFDLKDFKIEWLFFIERDIIFNELKKIKGLKKIIQSSLKNNFDKELSDIYTKNFL